MKAEGQTGFRSGRFTISHKMVMNQDVHLFYVDLKKAFNIRIKRIEKNCR